MSDILLCVNNMQELEHYLSLLALHPPVPATHLPFLAMTEIGRFCIVAGFSH